eukprot:3484222-Pleurochrysis_carterae.AAC.1
MLQTCLKVASKTYDRCQSYHQSTPSNDRQPYAASEKGRAFHSDAIDANTAQTRVRFYIDG